MMAVLANGCPYVPLDLDLPIARNELIIQHAGVKTIISSTEHTDIQFNVPVINIENINFDSVTEFNDSSSPFDNAYIIYTSGSTGLPKGVYQNQRRRYSA